MDGNIIVGLDIGTTKIGVLIGELDAGGEVNIVGVGVTPSDGLRKGVVINIDKTVKAIEKAVDEAELMAGIDVDSVYVGIAGDHIKSINSKGVIAVSRSDHEITPNDIDRVLEAAKAVPLPMDREILHVIPQEYIVDDQTGIKDPVGMCGVRMEAEVHIVTGAVTSVQNVFRSVEKAGLKINDIVLEPLASSYAVLNNDEKELGVVLLDMGGGTTDLAIFFEDSIRHSAVVGLGGKNVTGDIAIGLRTPVERAEEIKRRHGLALSSMVKGDEYIEVPGVGGRESKEVSRSVLASIIEPRLEEIFNLVLREIRRTEYADMLGAGLVITGGGALLEGCLDLAERVFKMPVRLGTPVGFGGLTESVKNPIFSTGVGLALYGARNGDGVYIAGEGNEFFKRVVIKMRDWVKEYF
ncbi:MAG: cell division protein FtsA [bacterium]